MKQRQSRAERLGDDIGENGRRAGNFCRFFSRICGAAAKKPKRTKCKEEFFFIFPPETLRFFAAAENKSQERNAEQNGLSKHSHEVARISFKANETKGSREMSEQKIETKYVNLSKKFKIDRDDFEAQFERLTRYILQTYNFGTELVTLAFLELIRNGDIPGDIEVGQRQGTYRRAPDEDQSAAENAIKKPSEIITSAIRAKAAQGKQGAPGETGKTETVVKQLEGQLNIFDEKQMPGEEKAKGE